MRLGRRIRALETRMVANPVILYFADGSTRVLHGRKYFLLDLLRSISGENLSSGQAAQLDLIYQSVAAHEPGGGHMVELLRALHAPAEDGVADET
jgi:hypothetical protein